MLRPPILKVLWVMAVTLGLVFYARWRLTPPPAYSVTLGGPLELQSLIEGGVVTGLGPDTVVVFSTYSCPFCRNLAEQIDSVLKEDSAAFTVVFQHFVHPRVDSAAYRAAAMAVCAAAQRRFPQMSRHLFAWYGTLDLVDVNEAVAAAGVPDPAAFVSCIDDPVTHGALAAGLQTGMTLRVTATPTIVTRKMTVVGVPPLRELLRDHRELTND